MLKNSYSNISFKWALGLILLLLLNGGGAMLYAQLPDDIYDSNFNDGETGQNPFQDEEEPGTKKKEKKKKVKQPLESYFFNDSIRALRNFSWTIDNEYNKVDIIPLDTTLLNWRIDYPFNVEGVGGMYLGALGQATQPINYFTRANYFDFSYAQAFDDYIYSMESVKFYNSKTPFTLFNYLESGQNSTRETNFRILHTQNISPSTNFVIDYKTQGTKGQYDREATSNKNLSMLVSHTGKRYSVHAGYINNRIQTQESGGVVGVWAVRDTTYELTSAIPMKLSGASATNDYSNNTFFVQQSYGIPLLPLTERDFSMAHLPAFYVGHSFEYSKWTKIYKDVYSEYTNERGGVSDTGQYVEVVDTYYDNWYINPVMTNDQITESRLSNRLFLQAQPWNRDGVIGTMNGGVGIDNYLYSQFGMDSYIAGVQSRERLTAWYGYGSIEGKISKYLDWGADAKVFPSGYRAGDSSFGANIALKAYIRNKPLILSGKLTVDSSTPAYWEQNLFSNHYVWFTPLNKEGESRLQVKFDVPDYNLELSAWQAIVSDKVYYDQNSNVTQASGNISLTGMYARKEFVFGGLHLDNRVLLQWSTNDVVVPLPLASVNLSYYYEFWVVENVLRLQLGVDGRYTTSYYMPGYNPALSTFYNQREYQLGDYPYLDIFLAGKWKNVRVFLKYQHANQGIIGNGEYFTVAGYAQNPAMFRLGFSWGFYD